MKYLTVSLLLIMPTVAVAQMIHNTSDTVNIRELGSKGVELTIDLTDNGKAEAESDIANHKMKIYIDAGISNKVLFTKPRDVFFQKKYHVKFVAGHSSHFVYDYHADAYIK